MGLKVVLQGRVGCQTGRLGRTALLDLSNVAPCPFGGKAALNPQPSAPRCSLQSCKLSLQMSSWRLQGGSITCPLCGKGVPAAFADAHVSLCVDTPQPKTSRPIGSTPTSQPPSHAAATAAAGGSTPGVPRTPAAASAERPTPPLPSQQPGQRAAPTPGAAGAAAAPAAPSRSASPTTEEPICIGSQGEEEQAGAAQPPPAGSQPPPGATQGKRSAFEALREVRAQATCTRPLSCRARCCKVARRPQSACRTQAAGRDWRCTEPETPPSKGPLTTMCINVYVCIYVKNI
jgi:hypothetical protein